MNNSGDSYSSEKLDRLDKVIYPILTTGMHILYDWKLIFNLIIGALLGVLLAIGTVPDSTSWGKAYISLGVVIIMDLMFNRFIREKSRTFQFSNSLMDLMILPIGRRDLPVIHYNKYKHALTLSFLDFLELIKVGAGIFCVYDLIKLNIYGVYINYCIFALLSVEAGIGVIAYSIATPLVLFRENSFLTWLNYIAEHYVRHTCGCTFYYVNDRIYRECFALDQV